MLLARAACPFTQEAAPGGDDPSAFKFVLKSPVGAVGFFEAGNRPVMTDGRTHDTPSVYRTLPQAGWNARQLENLFLWFEAGTDKGGASLSRG